ncbi:hypothetical protein JCM17845_04330 [Iodidimonas gelatinilytica]|uniref:Uncharacterized protein n=1 Tax=Iodidimonas gelatinilytica TaxID=1236966 RepID=A0A5A7MXU6_9PROT|nr:putative 2OG-Fe(II) oxygenase [Iodidimonas gelatinilytica]GEQ99809.1 hypothetical protein JCM17845_04330 [Iodidimonas gelatinilytica]
MFETPVVVSRLAQAAQINPRLLEAIRARRAENPGIARSNILGWHSDTEMLQWGGSAAADLLQHMVRLCDLQTSDTGAIEGAPPRFVWGFEMWANVSPPNASNQSHAHPGAIWSAVYYVDDGYAGSKERTLGGNWFFTIRVFP